MKKNIETSERLFAINLRLDEQEGPGTPARVYFPEKHPYLKSRREATGGWARPVFAASDFDIGWLKRRPSRSVTQSMPRAVMPGRSPRYLAPQPTKSWLPPAGGFAIYGKTRVDAIEVPGAMDQAFYILTSVRSSGSQYPGRLRQHRGGPVAFANHQAA